jgi:hypothetical protein
MRRPVKLLLVGTTLVLLGSCSHPDERLVQMAQEGADRQAEQNRQMSALQQEVTARSRAAIKADIDARKHFSELQSSLQAEQSMVGRQRDLLEEERRALTKDRQRSPVIAAAVLSAATLLASGLPLLLCWYVLRDPTVDDGSRSLADTLIEELAEDSPRLAGPSVARLPSGPQVEPHKV